MFKKALKMLGYIPIEDVRHLDFSDDEIFFILNKSLGYIDILESNIDIEDENKIFKDMSEIDGIHDYFRKTLAKDIKRFFNSQPGPQMLEIRGAYKRTLYFKKKITERDSSIDTNLTSERHL